MEGLRKRKAKTLDLYSVKRISRSRELLQRLEWHAFVSLKPIVIPPSRVAIKVVHCVRESRVGGIVRRTHVPQISMHDDTVARTHFHRHIAALVFHSTWCFALHDQLFLIAAKAFMRLPLGCSGIMRSGQHL